MSRTCCSHSQQQQTFSLGKRGEMWCTGHDTSKPNLLQIQKPNNPQTRNQPKESRHPVVGRSEGFFRPVATRQRRWRGCWPPPMRAGPWVSLENWPLGPVCSRPPAKSGEVRSSWSLFWVLKKRSVTNDQVSLFSAPANLNIHECLCWRACPQSNHRQCSAWVSSDACRPMLPASSIQCNMYIYTYL